MLSFQSLKSTVVLLVVALAGLVAACSPQTPAPTTEQVVPHLNELGNAVSSGSSEDLLALIQFSSLPCSKAEGLGGAPQCLSSEAEGTLVEVLPILGPEGHHIRRADFNSWSGIGAAQLFAAYRTGESTYSDEFFPAGDFGVAFLLEDRTNGVIFQVTEDGVVRIDFLNLPSIQSILDDSEVIYGPIPMSE